MTLDAYGNAGLLTRMDDNHSFNEYETNYLAFNCYRLEGLNKPQHSAVTQPVHQNITKKRSHDSSQDSQEDYMTDNCMEVSKHEKPVFIRDLLLPLRFGA